ncbi:MAG: redoxin [Limisphaerales bacterium]|nr:MAG: redoxin [Limisphaerales bacterium]KAG0510149.1 MAG: redoxin [Limisphaerales bacterium]
MQPLLSRLLLIALLAATLIACKRADGKEELLVQSDERYLPMVGKPSPPLKFKALDGREVDLEKLNGKVVLLDFWATWCPPCIEEIPHVRAAYERYNKEGFEIVGISFDADRQRLEDVVKRENLRWPQYFDGGGQEAAPGKTFGIRHWPSMWLLDRNGVIRFISAGAGLDRKITALLKETGNPVNAARGVFENKAALDRSGDEPAKPTAATKPGGPIAPPGAPQDAAYLHWLGKPFPALKFKAIDGREVDTDKLRGKVLLIDFWATWCPPCMAEIPNVKSVYERYNKQGFEIIGVSGDDSRADLERVVKAKGLTWPQLLEGRSGEVPNLRRYGVQHFPSMWLVDKQGIIRDVTGAVALNDKVAKLVAESYSPAPVAAAPPKTTAPASPAPPPPANAAASSKPAPASPAVAPATAPAPAPAARGPETKLGDLAVAVKNITITSKRSTALLQIGPSTYTVSPGTELVFPSGGAQRKARCEAVERSAVVLSIEGTTEPLRLPLP